MLGVDQNKGLYWVGASVGLWRPLPGSYPGPPLNDRSSQALATELRVAPPVP
jgi:hypothetical protein